MNENANPLDYILKCAEQGLIPKLFTVQNAKDELNKLRKELNNMPQYYDIGCIQVNDGGDLYCPRLQFNPYLENTIPLYVNKEELKKFVDKGR
jgi:hypothetical protein